jgi:hypothetical protein
MLFSFLTACAYAAPNAPMGLSSTRRGGIWKRKWVAQIAAPFFVN